MDLLHKHYLPSDWEEQWRRDKERRKKSIEEGNEEQMKRDRNELKRIVEYNDARMGLPSRERERDMSGMSQEVFGGWLKQEALGYEKRVVTYRSDTHPSDLFTALKTMQESRVLTDLCLVASNNQSIEVHAPVLASVSSYVREKLKDEVKDQADTDSDVQVRGKTLSLCPEVEHAGLLAVVEFAYTGAAASSVHSVDLTRAAAQTLGVSRLVELCDRGVEWSRKKDSPVQDEEEELQSLEQMKTTLHSLNRLLADEVGCDVTLDLDETSVHGRHCLILLNHILSFQHEFEQLFFSLSSSQSYLGCEQ